MEKQKKVIDASVIFKWFSNEENSDKAVNLMKEQIEEKTLLIVPDFAILEVLNALRYKKDSKEISNANRDLWDIQLKKERLNPQLLDKSIDLALKYNITVYDALYVAIAQFHGAPLISADKELFKLPNVLPLKKS